MPADIDVWPNDASVRVNVIAVETGAMVGVFADDAEAPDGSAMAFASTGDSRGSGAVLSPEEVSVLLA
jgi:hypothetical protein